MITLRIGIINLPDCFTVHEIIRTKKLRLCYSFINPSIGLDVSKYGLYIYIYKLQVFLTINNR